MSLSPSASSRRRLVRAALGATLTVGLLAGCAQEEPLEDTAPTTASTPTTTATQEPPTEAVTSSPTTDAAPTTEAAPSTQAPATTAPADDDAVTSDGPDGTLAAADGGFTVSVPEGWEDAIELVDVDSVQLAMKAEEQVDGFFTNILVTKEEYVRNLSAAVEEAAQELAGEDAEYELLEPAPVDGNRAPGYTITREVQGKSLVQTQRWISHDGTLYVVTLSALAEEAEEAAPVLQDLLDSWRWQD